MLNDVFRPVTCVRVAAYACLAVLVVMFGGCAGTGTETYTSPIVINEVQSTQNGEGYIVSDFAELYNTSSADYTFQAGEWYITDSGGASAHIFYIPSGTTIAAKGYLVLLPNGVDSSETVSTTGYLVCANETTSDGVTNIKFGLGSEDSISLFYTGSSNPSPSTAVDSTSWTSHVSTRARVPDGGDWNATDDRTPTPGATNGE